MTDLATRLALGRRLHQLMTQKGWKASELARNAGLTRDQVAAYLRGDSLASAESLGLLAVALGIAPEELLAPDRGAGPDATPNQGNVLPFRKRS